MISETDRLALRAASPLSDPDGLNLRQWWESVELDTAGPSVWRLSSRLYQRGREFGFDGVLLNRLRGIARHVWIGNELRLRSLSAALEVIRPLSSVVLLKGAATFAYDPGMEELRPMGDVDVLVDPDAAPAVLAALVAAGWSSQIGDIEQFTSADYADLHAVGMMRGVQESIDLHWFPLRNIRSRRFTRHLLKSAVRIERGHDKLDVPRLTEHLFILLIHGLTANDDGRLDWALEAGLILDGMRPQVNPSLLEALARRFLLEDELRASLAFVEQEVGVTSPLPIRRQSRQAPRWIRRSQTWTAVTGEMRDRMRTAGGGSAAVGKMLRSPHDRLRLAWAAFATRTGPKAASDARRWGVLAASCSAPPSHGRLVRLAGWSFPESEGVWTDGRRAALAVDSQAAPGMLVRLTLSFTPYLPNPGDSLRVTFDAGAGRETLEFSESDGDARSHARTIMAKVESNRCVVVGISIDAPIQSRSSSFPLEPRELGVLLHDVTVNVPGTTSRLQK